MIRLVTYDLKKHIRLVLMIMICLLLLLMTYAIIELKINSKKFDKIAEQLDQITQEQTQIINYMQPPLTSSEDFQGEKSHFLFSPDKKLISFVQNVFEEYGRNWSNYWALKVFNLQTGQEKTLVIDDTRMSTYDWLSNQELRVFHNAGTGLRVYLDISVNKDSPLFTTEHPNDWISDEEYIQRAKNFHEARNVYLEAIQK